jgi:septal ring factor EnvC (AmiA/AmiB activator)
MTHIEALKAEIHDLERKIAAAKRELAQLSREFSESNDQLGQLHLSTPITTDS